MKKTLVIALSSLALISCATTNDATQESTATNADYSQLTQTAIMVALNLLNQQAQPNAVTENVSQQASVTSEQAMGGVSSLLAFAQNTLSKPNNSELNGLIPGLSTLQESGLTSAIANRNTVDMAFSSLGMDPALVTTFTPIILQVLQTQGASSSLLGSLSSIWQ